MGERTRIASGSPFESSIGFSRAVRVGDRVLVSGTAPVWPDGSCPDDATAQARRCFEIIGDALTEAGTDLGAVVRTRMYLTDPAVADAVGAKRGHLFGLSRPAATMVIVAGLLDPRWSSKSKSRPLSSRSGSATEDQELGDIPRAVVPGLGNGDQEVEVTSWQ